jgi:hypothetical protein
VKTWRVVGHIRREEDEHGPAQDIPVIEVVECEWGWAARRVATEAGDHAYWRHYGYTFHPVIPPLRPLQVGDVVRSRTGKANGLVVETFENGYRVRWSWADGFYPRSHLRLVLTADGQPYTGEDA